MKALAIRSHDLAVPSASGQRTRVQRPDLVITSHLLVASTSFDKSHHNRGSSLGSAILPLPTADHAARPMACKRVASARRNCTCCAMASARSAIRRLQHPRLPSLQPQPHPSAEETPSNPRHLNGQTKRSITRDASPRQINRATRRSRHTSLPIQHQGTIGFSLERAGPALPQHARSIGKLASWMGAYAPRAEKQVKSYNASDLMPRCPDR